MKTQTAVQWLAEQFDSIVELYPSEYEKINNAIEQAKAMEKEQIIDAWDNGYDNQCPIIDEENCGEQYYNETFNK